MFIAIYKFQVKPGCETQLEDSWGALTDLIYRHEGSLGSRLHRDEEGSYIAYAQWPDRETWASADNLPPDLADPVSQKMRESCDKIETIYKLEVTDDRLKTRPSPSSE